MGIETSAAHGGAESSFVSAIIAIEELAKVDPSVSVMCDVHNTLVNTILRKYGTKEQQDKWLPQLAQSKVQGFRLAVIFVANNCATARVFLPLRASLWIRRICTADSRTEKWGPLDHQWFQDVDHEFIRSRDFPHLRQCKIMVAISRAWFRNFPLG